MRADRRLSVRNDVLFAVTVAIGMAFAACGETRDEQIETVQSALINAPGCGTVPTNSVCACQHPNFTGTCINFTNTLRFYMNISLSPYSALNDQVTSVWVGPDAKTKFCRDPAMGGECMSASGAAPDGLIMSNLFNFCDINGGAACCYHQDCPNMWCCQNDQTSSIRVDNKTEDCQNPGLSRVAFFTDTNYGGDCVVLFRQQGVTLGWPNPSGNATNAQQGGGFGLPDNSISSIKIGVPGPGHNFDVYENANFGGASLYYGNSIPNLGTWGFDNRISSIKTLN